MFVLIKVHDDDGVQADCQILYRGGEVREFKVNGNERAELLGEPKRDYGYMQKFDINAETLDRLSKLAKEKITGNMIREKSLLYWKDRCLLAERQLQFSRTVELD